jgi:hypothetical protein
MSGSGELIVVDVAPSEAEAQLVLSVLRGAGIDCMSRMTNRAAGIGDGLGNWGPHEVLVRSADAEAARELLSEDAPADPTAD